MALYLVCPHGEIVPAAEPYQHCRWQLELPAQAKERQHREARGLTRPARFAGENTNTVPVTGIARLMEMLSLATDEVRRQEAQVEDQMEVQERGRPAAWFIQGGAEGQLVELIGIALLEDTRHAGRRGSPEASGGVHHLPVKDARVLQEQLRIAIREAEDAHEAEQRAQDVRTGTG